MLEEKLSCLLHFLKTSETCQGNNSHDTLLNTSNDNLPWERSHCVCAPFLWGVWKSAGALHPEPVGKSLASLCGSCALLLQQKPLLTANPAPSCFSTGDRSVVRCYKSADSPFCPASEWGSPLPSSRKEQFSSRIALEGCAGGDGRGEKEISSFLCIFYSFSLIFLAFFHCFFSPSYLFPLLSLLSSPLPRSSCNYLTYTASLTGLNSITATYGASSPASLHVVLFLPQYPATVQWSSVIQQMRGKARGAASLSEPCSWYWWQFSWSHKSLSAPSQPDSSFAL